MTVACSPTLTDAQRAQLCAGCVDDPKAAPGRYCARFACVCGHEACPAFQFYIPRRKPEPLPDNLLHLTNPIDPHHEPTPWDQRDEPSWIDKL